VIRSRIRLVHSSRGLGQRCTIGSVNRSPLNNYEKYQYWVEHGHRYAGPSKIAAEIVAAKVGRYAEDFRDLEEIYEKPDIPAAFRQAVTDGSVQVLFAASACRRARKAGQMTLDRILEEYSRTYLAQRGWISDCKRVLFDVGMPWVWIWTLREIYQAMLFQPKDERKATTDAVTHALRRIREKLGGPPPHYTGTLAVPAKAALKGSSEVLANVIVRIGK
jgi:hypothetical protein